MTTTRTQASIKGPSDLYQHMTEVKSGKRGFAWITKKQAKECGISWDFVEKSAQILGLQVSRSGSLGFSIDRPAK